MPSPIELSMPLTMDLNTALFYFDPYGSTLTHMMGGDQMVVIFLPGPEHSDRRALMVAAEPYGKGKGHGQGKGKGKGDVQEAGTAKGNDKEEGKGKGGPYGKGVN